MAFTQNVTFENIQDKPMSAIGNTGLSKPKLLALTTLACVLIFGLLYLFTFDANSSTTTHFNATLLITLLIYLPSVYMTLRADTKTSKLLSFCENNKNRFYPTSQPRGDFALRSILADAVYSSAVQNMAEKLPETYTGPSGIYNNDQTLPNFYLGIIQEKCTYQGYLQLSLQLPQACPHILIDYDSTKHSLRANNFRSKLSNDQRYDLEGSFADNFTVYAPTPDAARFATYILPPNIMERVLAIAPEADIEIIDTKLIMVWKSHSAQQWEAVLPELFSMLNSVAFSLYERIDKYANDNKDLLSYSEDIHYSYSGSVVKTSTSNYVKSDLNATLNVMRLKGFWLTVGAVFIIIMIVLYVQATMGATL